MKWLLNKMKCCNVGCLSPRILVLEGESECFLSKFFISQAKKAVGLEFISKLGYIYASPLAYTGWGKA